MFPRFNNSLVFGLGTKLMKLLMRDRNEKKLKQEIDMKCKWGGCHLFAPVSEMSLAKKIRAKQVEILQIFYTNYPNT